MNSHEECEFMQCKNSHDDVNSSEYMNSHNDTNSSDYMNSHVPLCVFVPDLLCALALVLALAQAARATKTIMLNNMIASRA